MLLSYLSNIIKGTTFFNMPSAGCIWNFLSCGMKHRKCKQISKKFSILLIKLIFILKPPHVYRNHSYAEGTLISKKPACIFNFSFTYSLCSKQCKFEGWSKTPSMLILQMWSVNTSLLNTECSFSLLVLCSLHKAPNMKNSLPQLSRGPFVTGLSSRTWWLCRTLQLRAELASRWCRAWNLSLCLSYLPVSFSPLLFYVKSYFFENSWS